LMAVEEYRIGRAVERFKLPSHENKERPSRGYVGRFFLCVECKNSLPEGMRLPFGIWFL
jgi:hypothetical protein